MIDNGWFDWAERVPGAQNKVNGWDGPASGFIAHSAEGWEKYLREASANPGNSKSWHLSNLLDGTLLQHYPIYAQCWSSGHATPNNNYVAMEAEGLFDTPLNEAQTATVIRVLADLGWSPERHKTVFEHNDFTATACPSGRYDWATILAPQPVYAPGDVAMACVSFAQFYRLDHDFGDLLESEKEILRMLYGKV